MVKKLEGKIALVTGGSVGIGLAAARQFAAEGASVVITGRRQPELDAAATAIGGDVLAIRSDAGKLADIDALVETVTAKKGRIDVLFANAGVYEFGAVGQITEAHFDKLFDINVKGLLFLVQKAAPVIADGGAIILTGSVSGSKGMAQFGVYNATKAAVRSFARTWAAELKDRRIRVNVVSPGPIATPGFDVFAQSSGDDAALRGHLAGLVPLGRMGTADEVARAAVFLASDDSSYVTGAELFVDGGFAQV